MLIKYYKNQDLAYANRKRYKTFNYIPDSEEIQNAVKLGDGARTTIKTSVSNLCNYVKIDDTRWYVVSYRYVNGGQVILNLQRDVVGEFGINNCFGKIERGYTDTFLRNRKELNLNQRLIDRIPLIPNTNSYGNFNVNTHNNEKWGIIYISKPTDGRTYANIPIKAFAPDNYNSNLKAVKNNYNYFFENSPNCSVNFWVFINNANEGHRLKNISINFGLSGYDNSWEVSNVSINNITETGTTIQNMLFTTTIGSGTVNDTDCVACLTEMAKLVGKFIIDNNNSGYILPTKETIELDSGSVSLYDTHSFLDEDTYYNSTHTTGTVNHVGGIGTKQSFFDSVITPTLNGNFISYINSQNVYTTVTLTGSFNSNTNAQFSGVANLTSKYATFTRTAISPSSSGILQVDFTEDLIDEPYAIFAIPLYDVTISGQGEEYNINQNNAFITFNTTIQYLSGGNGYLVDAQVYPYCPNLRKTSGTVNGIPIFYVFNTSYERDCSVQLNQYSDVKKEYIKREYSIMAPDQSKKFVFNYYDYYNNVNYNPEDANRSLSYTNVKIKTALKPFSIISSAVIQPSNDSLIGKTYVSDLRGCVPASSGFECSLSTDQFQQYVRNNTNYEKFFELDKAELQKQHQVERANEAVSTVVNTISATAMGAIAGGAVADAGIFNSLGSKAVGAGIGAASAGTLVGASMIGQAVSNEVLRKYEENLQKQRFDLTIGTIKNLPNQVSRVSSFNEIIMRDFYFVIEIYECSEQEGLLVDTFIEKYSYGLGIFGLYTDFVRNTGFIRGTLITSELIPILHQLLDSELKGGIYYYE